MAMKAISDAITVSLFGAGGVPGLNGWTPASIYLAFGALLKTILFLPPVLMIFDAPFGRFSWKDSKLNFPGRLAFSFMELPAPILFILAVSTPDQLSHDYHPNSAVDLLKKLINPSFDHLKQLPAANLILASLFVIHYTHRAILQPIFGPPRSPSHIMVISSAFLFSVTNGFTMGSWIGGRSPSLLVPTSLLSTKAAIKSVKSASWFAGILPRSKVASPGLDNKSILPIAHPGLLPSGTATLLHPLFILGVLGWAIGFASNVYHDEILFNLRRPDKRGGGPAEGTRNNVHKAVANGSSSEKSDNNDTSSTGQRYEVPQGGLYSLVSFPNYLSEWFEWSSFALAALSQTPLSPLSANAVPLTLVGRLALLTASAPVLFVLVEIASMLPRAVRGHQWYHTKFGVEGDNKGGRYPSKRKAVIPYVL